MLRAEGRNNGRPTPLLVLKAEPFLQAARHMESQSALGLGAIDRAPAPLPAKITLLLPPLGGQDGAIDAVPCLWIEEEDLRHEKRTHDVRPPAIYRGLHRTAFDGAEAAAGVRRLAIASRAEPIALGDGGGKGAAIAGGVDHEITAVTEDDGIERVAVGAPAHRAGDPIILFFLFLRFFFLEVGFFCFFFFFFFMWGMVEVDEGGRVGGKDPLLGRKTRRGEGSLGVIEGS